MGHGYKELGLERENGLEGLATLGGNGLAALEGSCLEGKGYAPEQRSGGIKCAPEQLNAPAAGWQQQPNHLGRPPTRILI